MNDPRTPSASLAELRKQVLRDVRRDRRIWRMTEVPQIVIILTLIGALLFLTGYGLANAITMMKSGKDTASIGQVLQIFVSGSSSLLGFVVFKLMVALDSKTKSFLMAERRFTSESSLVRLVGSRKDLDAFLREYYKPKV